TALLVPILQAGPAADTASATASAAAPATAEVPAALPVNGSFPAGLTMKTVIYNTQVTALQQRKTALTTDKASLTRAAATFDSARDTYNAKDAACAARVTAHNQKLDAHNAKVDAFNAATHTYVLPAEQAGYDAAQAEKQQLDAEGAALDEESASITAERGQLDTEEAQLTEQKTQLAADLADHNARAAAWTSDEQQAESTRRQLLAQMVAALQELLDAPPAQAAAMAEGADAAQPPAPAGAQPAQAPGGDPVSRSGQVASLAGYAVAQHVPMRFQPVAVRLLPGATAGVRAADAAQLPLSAVYDGLVPEENGHYLAVALRSSRAGTDGAGRAFDGVLAHGGQGTATVDGRPAVVDGTVTVPDDDRAGDPCNTGAGFTGSTIVYLPRHKHAGACVATGAFGQLGPANYTPPGRPGLRFALPGLTTLPEKNRSRGHLIGYAMGGSNKDTRNFVPLYGAANQWMFDHAEKPVVGAIKSGGHVYVEAYPHYDDPDSAVPTTVDYVTHGDVDEECVVVNNPTGAGSHCEDGS
ncbi:DNA/RNA non-specific endonuclease, partial [Actinacidiphila bryophytorum]